MILLLFGSNLFGEELEITGKVVNKTTLESIQDALIVAYPSGAQTISNQNGNFSLKVERTKDLQLVIKKAGYRLLMIKEQFEEIYAQLELETMVEGQKILVQSKRDEKRVVSSRQQVGRENIDRSTSNVFGDAVKVVQTLPGVVSANSFSALMFVRGGDAYEMMNYYDRLMLTNAYIWGGMLSVFNPDVVQNIDFYSGAFPAEYGNAMSGVLDVKMRDGRTDKIGGLFDLSMTTFTGLLKALLVPRAKPMILF